MCYRQSSASGEKMEEEEDGKKKITPQKERDNLEVAIVEDKKALVAQHEIEAAQLLSDQTEAKDVARKDQEERGVQLGLKQEQAQSCPFLRAAKLTIL